MKQGKRANRLHTNRRSGFTLIESLVVVAIIAILAALLAPGLRAAQERAKSAYCMSNLKQLATAGTSFAGDHDDRYPRYDYKNDVWNAPGRQMLPYLNDSTKVFICPSDRNHTDPSWWAYTGPGRARFGDPRNSYNYAGRLFGLISHVTPNQAWDDGRESTAIGMVKSPTKCYMWLDNTGDWSGVWWHDHPYDSFGGWWWDSIHLGTDNFAFVDGHVEAIDTTGLIPPPSYKGSTEYTVNGETYTCDPDY
jgi:prepilin-type N-terminal cleavage/methylation domain-containing protein/prepilin-type processing-associated H-X9-DG protein